MLHFITYGKDKNTGILRNIKDVPSGLNCNCVCPSCGTQLVAHKGNIRCHHFKHYSSNECKGAFESQIHLLSKAIIEENKALMLPKYKGRYISFSNKRQSFTEVIQECSQGELRPDCLCKYTDYEGNEQTIWVEILNTHEVDESKSKKIKEMNIACVEIDVSQLFKDTEIIDKDILTDFLLNQTDNRKWINNPYSDEAIQRDADVIRRQESIEKFLVENSVNENRVWKFEATILCLFSNRYKLNQVDYKKIYNTIYQHRTDYDKLPPESKRIYVSVVMMMIYQLIVTDKIKFSQTTDYLIDRNLIQRNLTFWISEILKHTQPRTTSFNIKPIYRRRRL